MRLALIMRARISLLTSAVVAGAVCALAFAADGIQGAVTDDLGRSLAFLAAGVALQLVGLRLPAGGSVGVSAVAFVGAAIALGTGPAMAIAALCALAQWAHARGRAERALFDAANFTLAAGAAGLTYTHVNDLSRSGLVQLAAAVLAGLTYTAVNHGLLCVAMALAETRSPLAVWKQRFHWARYHFLAFGVLALLSANAYAQLGAASLVAFLLPPVLLAHSMRQALTRTYA